jgi:hypothetical protein
VAISIFIFHCLQLSPAQKQIDAVLDIKDDDAIEILAEDQKMVKSKTMPSIQDAGRRKDHDDSVWGSFNGSFFESKPTPSSPITNAPPRKSDASSGELCGLFSKTHRNEFILNF